MKPPPRRRATPARYLGETTRPPAWSAREKRQLLRLLQARREQPEPDAADLARELPGRSAEEVSRLPGEARGGGRGLAGGRGYATAAPRGLKALRAKAGWAWPRPPSL